MRDEDLWLARQADAATEISRSIREHLVSPPLVMQALEGYERRLRTGLETLRVLQVHARHDFLLDGLTLLRAMYDAHLQALYILADSEQADARAKLFFEHQGIEQQRWYKLIERSPTRLARMELPLGPEVEAAFKGLRPKFLAPNGRDVRRDWYPGNLRELAHEVGLDSEYEILQRDLSGAVHSTPTALLSGSIFSEPKQLLLVGWKLFFRVLGRIAHHHGILLDAEHERATQEAMSNLYDLPADDAAPS